MSKNQGRDVKGYGFLSFGRNLSNKCIRQLMDTAIKKEDYML